MSASQSMTSFFARTDRSAIARWWWTVDKAMLACLIILMIVGVALVTSASPSVANRIGAEHSHFITRHIIFVVPSLFIMLGVSVLDHLWIRRVGTVLFGAVVFFDDFGAVCWAGYQGGRSAGLIWPVFRCNPVSL